MNKRLKLKIREGKRRVLKKLQKHKIKQLI